MRWVGNVASKIKWGQDNRLIWKSECNRKLKKVRYKCNCNVKHDQSKGFVMVCNE
jgi:hypothetical protein